MVYKAASPVIESVNVRDVQKAGYSTDVVVKIRDTSNTTAEGENYNLAWVIVTSPQIDGYITWWCGIIQPGESVIVEDSTIDIANDSVFEMPKEDVTLTILAGGKPGDVHCRKALDVGTQTDTASETVDVFLESNVYGENFRVKTSPEQATPKMDIHNDNDEEAEVFLEVKAGSKTTARPSVTVPANSVVEAAYDINYNLDPGESVTDNICLNILLASPPS